MIKQVLVLCSVIYWLSFSAFASTAILNLNTIQQLQRQQVQQNGNNNRNHAESHGGGGMPVYDAAAIEVAKREMYLQWKKENKSQMSYDDWDKTTFGDAHEK
ncbi:hypothetical protein H8C17_002622 [Salmonella enterica]|nr:hypothetical protein [Salmonella enterica]ELS6025035.1 hypothetical protein [Salmonella enterica]